MIYLIFVLAALTRFLSNPHVQEFSPIFGALLFSGARLSKRDAVWFPSAVLAICDWILTTRIFHMQMKWEHCFTVLAFAAIAWTGGFLRYKVTGPKLAGCSIAGPTAYFLISNFGVWLGWGLYPHTWTGLATCYLAALPYYRNSLLNTFVIAALLFGSDELIARRMYGKHFESAAAPVH